MEEMKSLTYLYYLVEGEDIGNKNGQSFTIPSGQCVSEISFILGSKATVIVKIKTGSKNLSWYKSALKELLLKYSHLQQTFEVRIAGDMAIQLARYQPLANDY